LYSINVVINVAQKNGDHSTYQEAYMQLNSSCELHNVRHLSHFYSDGDLFHIASAQTRW